MVSNIKFTENHGTAGNHCLNPQYYKLTVRVKMRLGLLSKQMQSNSNPLIYFTCRYPKYTCTFRER